MPQTCSSSPPLSSFSNTAAPTPVPPLSHLLRTTPCQKHQRSCSGPDFRAPGPLKTASAAARTVQSPDLHARGAALRGTLRSPRRCPPHGNSLVPLHLALAPTYDPFLHWACPSLLQWPSFPIPLPGHCRVSWPSRPAPASLAQPARPRHRPGRLRRPFSSPFGSRERPRPGPPPLPHRLPPPAQRRCGLEAPAATAAKTARGPESPVPWPQLRAADPVRACVAAPGRPRPLCSPSPRHAQPRPVCLRGDPQGCPALAGVGDRVGAGAKVQVAPAKEVVATKLGDPEIRENWWREREQERQGECVDKSRYWIQSDWWSPKENVKLGRHRKPRLTFSFLSSCLVCHY